MQFERYKNKFNQKSLIYLDIIQVLHCKIDHTNLRDFDVLAL